MVQGAIQRSLIHLHRRTVIKILQGFKSTILNIHRTKISVLKMRMVILMEQRNLLAKNLQYAVRPMLKNFKQLNALGLGN